MIQANEQTMSPSESLRLLSEEIKMELLGIEKLTAEMSKVIVGQEKMVEGLLIALLTNGRNSRIGQNPCY